MERFTVTVFCGSSPGFDPIYVDAARAVGTAIGRAGMNLVYGGGHVGLMGTVADAAVAAGAHVTGVIPRALQAREAVNHNIAELVIVDIMDKTPEVDGEYIDPETLPEPEPVIIPPQESPTAKVEGGVSSIYVEIDTNDEATQHRNQNAYPPGQQHGTDG